MPPVVALLGPTNTGKTFLAMERMLEHATGMIGFPLRLLARENYDRVVRARGADRVALVTGEERIVPPHPRYWVCTVEAMPLDVPVEFLAVDEVQLAADRERGHVFTDRLLHARGNEETMFMGSDTIRPLLAPEALRARATLWHVRHPDSAALPVGPASLRAAGPPDPRRDAASGYESVAGLLLRVDALEEALTLAHQQARGGQPPPVAKLARLLHCDADAVPRLLAALGLGTKS